MENEQRHMRACLAALRQIRGHVQANPEIEEHDSALFDVWMSKLEDGTGQDFSQFQIDDAYVPSHDFLVTVSSIIAYLESMLGIETPAAGPESAPEATPIDADFTDVEPPASDTSSISPIDYFRRRAK